MLKQSPQNYESVIGDQPLVIKEAHPGKRGKDCFCCKVAGGGGGAATTAAYQEIKKEKKTPKKIYPSIKQKTSNRPTRM